MCSILALTLCLSLAFGGFCQVLSSDADFYTVSGLVHPQNKLDVIHWSGREKREVDEGFDFPDNETSSDNVTVIDHKYYSLKINPPNADTFNQHWVDIAALLSSRNKSIVGNLTHPQLSNSYRRAVVRAGLSSNLRLNWFLGSSSHIQFLQSHQLQFKFPFYGHMTQNITIATGGFLYAGEHMHSWLAATQYIAPLMANFDTTLSNESYIMFADTGDFVAIEWHNTILRGQENAGNFTFQVVLHKTGDIQFLYKKIPIPVKNVSDVHHPRKVGLSDAYLFMHQVNAAMNRRVIYEYHRIDIDLQYIQNLTVIEITALPVCISIPTCELCMGHSTPSFNCSWCNVPHVSGGPFCSEQQGLHRRRQDWLDHHCDTEVSEKNSEVYCESLPSKAAKTDLPKSTTPVPTTSILEVFTSPSDGKTTTEEASVVDVPVRFGSTTAPSAKPPAGFIKSEVTKEAVPKGSMSSGGVVAVIFILLLIFSVMCWMAYAYYNPHTPSGQFLIRNRPARWRWPGPHGDVRYTASVHM